jgi:predicted Zn-dependent peptidase
MKSIKLVLLVCLCSLAGVTTHAQGLKAFQLPNGLQVYVWEDANMSEVFGMVAVNVGSKEEPEEYTGLAHYLEHLMFKGTDKIGTLDWGKEKPVYEQIIAKYDERAKVTDAAQRDALAKEINELSIQAAQVNMPNELEYLIQNIAGKQVNAFTSYDETVYYTTFPSGEIYKWLELNCERFKNPIFRNFQAELETVYEEYNRGQDGQGTRESEFLMENLFPGHPYSRSVIGLPEHLKNPQLSKLIEFYETWYVPNNMALILVGNLQTNQLVSMIRSTFGQLQSKPLPERKQYPAPALKGRKEVSAKLSRFPQLILSFPGIPAGDPDLFALQICTSILSNGNNTGLLDKLELDGDVQGVSASAQPLKERGVVLVSAVPYYDVNQRRFESLNSTEKMIWKEIKKLQEGQFEDWLVQSIKSDLIRGYDLEMESNYMGNGANMRALQIMDCYINGRDMGDLLNYKERVAAITTDEIKAIAKKYFGPDFLSIHMNEGKPPKGKEIDKPKLEPVTPVRNGESDYAKSFKLLPARHVPDFANMDDAIVRPINDRSKLFYSTNPENEIFSLTIQFGVGTAKMPKLALAVPLVNNAGIMAQLDAQEVKQEFSNLGTTCYYTVDDDYLSVILYGFETNLEASCNLLTRQILLPALDEKQMNSRIGGYYQQRRFEKEENSILSNALFQYVLYKDKSDYIDRLNMSDVIAYSISDLTGEFQRATDYEAEVYYVGNRPIDEVHDILSRNLPMKQGEKESTSPEVKEMQTYAENTVFFLPNNNAKQSSIYFYIRGDEYSNEKDPYIDAFNQYFGSGFFTDLVSQEIREYRSMAYSSGAVYAKPALKGKPAAFYGSIGTQADKTLDAIDVFMSLVNDMPLYPERIANIKNHLKGSAEMEKPQFRNANELYEVWKLHGYTQSPAQTNMKTIDSLTFDDIVKFYEENIKGRPIVIAISGNPKQIDEKALAKYGKVTRLSTSRLFSDK